MILRICQNSYHAGTHLPAEEKAMRPFARFLLLISCLTFALGTFASEALRVGVSPDYPPLAYKDHGDLTGIDVAAAEVIGQQLKRKVQFNEMRFEELIPALEAGKIDIIMSGMTITAERSQRVTFSKPYLNAGQMAIIRFADAGHFGSKGAMFRPGARVAIQKGTTSEDFANQYLKNASITLCNSSDEAFALLKSSKVDFMLHDAATSWALATDKNKQDLMSMNTELTDEKLGWAVNKNNQALLQSVNQQLDIMQGNGMLRAIIRKWIPVTVEVQNSITGNTSRSSSTTKTSTKNGNR
jgi:ABC-type amino acid transport substrate-binding protein